MRFSATAGFLKIVTFITNESVLEFFEFFSLTFIAATIIFTMSPDNTVSYCVLCKHQLGCHVL